MGMIKNLIWDLDGTLFDTYPSISAAFQAVVRQHGADTPLEQIMPLARVSFDHCAAELSQKTGLDAEQILLAFYEHYAKIPPAESPPFSGVRELCTLAVNAGGRNVIVTHRQRASTEALLEAHSLRALFTGWITHDDGFPRKPAPDSFLAALSRFKLDPAETLALGDRDLDLQAARSAGVAFSCAYGPGPFSITADFRVTGFGRLLELLRVLNGDLHD